MVITEQVQEKVMQKNKYQCGHYAKSKFGQCQKNTISAEWIEGEVIAYVYLELSLDLYQKREVHFSEIWDCFLSAFVNLLN